MLESNKKKKKKKTDDEKSNKNNDDVMDEWRMKAFALAALRRCFAYDSVNFLTQERFNQFAPLVAKHLSKEPPKKSREYPRRILSLASRSHSISQRTSRGRRFRGGDFD